MVTHGTDGAGGAFAVGVTFLVATAAVASVGLAAVGTASAAPTGVDECTTITESGAYELRANLSVSGDTCLSIRASDVTLDGNGHAVERTAPSDDPPPSDYRESAAVLVGGSDPVTNVTVTNATVRVESLESGEGTTSGIAFRDASGSVLSDVHLTSRVWPTVEVVGSNNTVRNVTRVKGVFRIVGDDNVLADSVAGTGDDVRYATSVTGDRNLIENLTSLGDPGLRIAGRASVVRDSTFGGVYSPAANVTNAPDIGLVNNTFRHSRLRVANSGSSVIRANTVDHGLALIRSDDSEVVGNDLTYRLALVETDHALVRDNRIEGVRLYGSASNLIYDNLIDAEDPVTVEAAANASVGANRWNVTPRPGENAVGGDTVAGNYYGNDARGFSRTCEDADGDGLCDSAYRIAENNTDDHPLADPANGSDGAGNYQVDFVAGDPIENLSADRLYAQQDRLLRFAFGNETAGVTERGSAWPSESVRECVDYGHIAEDDGTASVSFTVADGCSNVTLSLAVHSLPGETFETATADQQELLTATTRTYGPGEHAITVDLPDASVDPTAPAVRRVAPHSRASATAAP